MMSNNFCIVIQGPTRPNLINHIRKSWQDYPVIFSTWEGSENYYNNTDTVIFSKMEGPSGRLNVNYQKISSLNGFYLAKKLGYDYVLKWRSDMYPTNTSNFISLLNQDMLNIYSVVYRKHGYFADYFKFGKINQLIDIFSFHEEVPYPEYGFTKSILKTIPTENINIIGNLLSKDNDIIWKSNISFFEKYKGPIFGNTIPNNMKTNYNL